MSAHSLLQLVPNRVAATVKRLKAGIWTRVDSLVVEATEPTPHYISWQDALTRTRNPVSAGQAWGRLYDQRWCRLESRAAGGAPQPALYLEWSDQAEATLYVGGCPHYGFDVAHRYCEIAAGASELWIESVCVQTGIWHPEATGLSDQGSLFAGAYLVRRNDEVWHAYHDLNCLHDLMLSERPGGPLLNVIGQQPSLERAPPAYRRLLRMLDECVDELDRGGVERMRRRLAEAYAELRSDEPIVRTKLTGHAHIDLVWLWPERVGEFKAIHTFATAERMMQVYPEFRFAHSQPASYEAIARRAPPLFESVKGRVASGQWEPTGALYVESDTQLPCGEGLARAFSMGQAAFAQLRGSPAALMWLPDAFGYSSCLPQLMQLSGVNFFFTNKVAWSAVNRFPLSSFVWRGSDGSEVVAHVLQDVGYNGTVLPDDLKRAAEAHVQSDIHPELLYPTGYGDGGGGPTEEMCERARRLSNIRALPGVAWDSPEAFFGRLARRRADLPIYSGELYLEFHRGTYTTHSSLKAAFRALERALQVREAAAVVTGTPVDLKHEWRRMLLAQFHDFIPGSSIPEVYAEGVPELVGLADILLGSARERLELGADRDRSTSHPRPTGELCFFNPLPISSNTIIDGRRIVLPPLSSLSASAATVADAVPVEVDSSSLSNGIVTVRIDAMGWLTEMLVDGERLALQPGSGSLVIHPDRAANFESWDIDRQALDLGTVVESVPQITVELDAGGLRAAICVRRPLGSRHSSVLQRYVLESGSRVLRIEVELNWHELETLLKLQFRTGYRGTHVRCGCPFGSILRPQQSGPLAAEAMWEIPASRWIAGTDDGGRGGMFIVTEAKYGFSCRDGNWGVSLLRSPRMTGFESHSAAYPAGLSRIQSDSPYSDQGIHRIALAIGRFHSSGRREEHPASMADSLFTQPLPYVGTPMAGPLRMLSGGDGLIPSWAQPLEDGAWVLRLHEVAGEGGTATVELAPGWVAQKVDLLGRARDGLLVHGHLNFRPYEIVSLHISPRSAICSTDFPCGSDTPSAPRVSESNWNGFYREDFRVAGRDCILVSPAAALPGRPWIWRMEFFDAFPSLDLALLKAGLHLAYMNVQNLYGAPASLDLLDQFYEQLVLDRGMAARPVLEGFSRGALFALNWSARHPGRVACLYLDAPVCDFKSWPGGKGGAPGSAHDWDLLKKAYGFQNEAEAIGYAGTALDNLAPLAQARVPIIAVYGEADVDLPPEENILLLQRRYTQLGGEITVIAKPGVGHHPHSLLDPQPVLQFILARTS